MLQVSIPLAAAASETVNSKLLPTAGVSLEFKEGERRVHITLKGVICGASVDSLLEFLRNASTFVGSKWSLQMSDLVVLSGRGMKALARFAKHQRRRGYVVRVAGINQNLYAMMKEMRLTHGFAWAD
ncbi:MAG: STAS domain-containing protein [candidate division KSB1 bacterium]